MDFNNKYIISIYERYKSLKKSNKTEFNNNDLWKIFEWYSCFANATWFFLKTCKIIKRI